MTDDMMTPGANIDVAAEADAIIKNQFATCGDANVDTICVRSHVRIVMVNIIPIIPASMAGMKNPKNDDKNTSFSVRRYLM